MLNKINRSIAIFEENFRAAKSAYVLNTSLEASACASAFIGQEHSVTTESLREAKKIVHSNTRLFSTLATISMSPDPHAAMDSIRKIHKALDKKFFNSDYLVLAATMIYKNCEPQDYDRMIARVREIYTLLRRDHPMITGREDLANCVLMAISEYSPDQIARRCEEDFQALRGFYHLKNRIQYMACISSVFEGRSDDKAVCIFHTQKALRDEKIRFYGDAFSVIAAVAMLVREEDMAKVAEAINDTSKKLRSIRGMGAMGTGKRIRDMIACAIVLDAYANDSNGRVRDTAISAIISAIIAVEVAIISSAAAASAAGAASSGS